MQLSVLEDTKSGNKTSWSNGGFWYDLKDHDKDPETSAEITGIVAVTILKVWTSEQSNGRQEPLNCHCEGLIVYF